MTEQTPQIVRGMLRTTKSADGAVARGADQVVADCRALATRCVELAVDFERLAAAPDDPRAKRFEFLGRGLRHTGEGVLGELEDL